MVVRNWNTVSSITIYCNRLATWSEMRSRDGEAGNEGDEAPAGKAGRLENNATSGSNSQNGWAILLNIQHRVAVSSLASSGGGVDRLRTVADHFEDLAFCREGVTSRVATAGLRAGFADHIQAIIRRRSFPCALAFTVRTAAWRRTRNVSPGDHQQQGDQRPMIVGRSPPKGPRRSAG